MTCREFVAGIGRRLDAALPPRTAARADRHRSGCRACGGYLDRYTDTLRLCRGTSRAAEADARAALPERLVRALVHAAAATAA